MYFLLFIKIRVMKNSLTCLVFISSFSFFTQERSWDGGFYVNEPAVQLTYSPKYYGGIDDQWHNVVNYDIKNTKTYNGRTENTVFNGYDSLSRITLERFILDRLNYFRTTMYGAKALVWEESLRPVTYHHVVYQRLLGKQTHFERWDVPNFTEMGIWPRINKFCGNKFESFSEGLINQMFQLKSIVATEKKNPTYKMLVDMFFTPDRGYNTCPLHWNDIVDKEWDCIFIYYDFEFINKDAASSSFIYANVTINYASYKK